MEPAIAALSEAAREVIVTLAWLASTISLGRPAPSAPTTITSLPSGRELGVFPPVGTAATVVKPALSASPKNSSESSSRETSAWKREPIVARTVLGLYRSAQPFERATPAPKACAERMTAPTLPGSCTPCNSTRRWQAAINASGVTSRNGNTPTGPVGVVSVERRRTSSGSLKSLCGGSLDSRIRFAPSARNSRSASRCFFWLSLLARLRESSGVRRLLVGGLLFGRFVDVADRDTAVLARALDGREIHVELLRLALGGIGGVNLPLVLSSLLNVAHDDATLGSGGLDRLKVYVQLLGPALGGVCRLDVHALLRLRSSCLHLAFGLRLLRLLLGGL